MPRRVPSDLDDRMDKMIQIWEKLGSEKVMGDLSLQIVRDQIADRQQAKDHQLLTDSADSAARIQLRIEDEKVYNMTVQTLQAVVFLFGSNSPEYKLAGGTPLSERGRGRNSRKPHAGDPPANPA